MLAMCPGALGSQGHKLHCFQAILKVSFCIPQETSDKSVIELQQYAKKNKPNLHILSKLQEEMKRLAEERVSPDPCLWSCSAYSCGETLDPRNPSLTFWHPEMPISVFQMKSPFL